ncbi:MAG: sulfotransferase [Pseudomonadota bacterium]
MITRTEKTRKFVKAIWHRLAVRDVRSTPVFILGEMRSGTNMLTDCLDRCWRTATYNESDDDAFVGYALRDDETVMQLVQKSRANFVVFKSLADLARARELLRLFPDAKVVWIFRNYQDVVNSAMRKWTEHNKYLSYILNDPERAGWRAKNLPKSLIEKIRLHYERGISDTSARALIWYVRNSMFFEQSLDSAPNVCLVRYEDLAQSPDQEFDRIFQFLNLPLSRAYYSRVSTRSIRRDKSPEVDGEIARLCEDLLDRMKNEIPANKIT